MKNGELSDKDLLVVFDFALNEEFEELKKERTEYGTGSLLELNCYLELYYKYRSAYNDSYELFNELAKKKSTAKIREKMEKLAYLCKMDVVLLDIINNKLLVAKSDLRIDDPDKYYSIYGAKEGGVL